MKVNQRDELSATGINSGSQSKRWALGDRTNQWGDMSLCMYTYVRVSHAYINMGTGQMMSKLHNSDSMNRPFNLNL